MTEYTINIVLLEFFRADYVGATRNIYEDEGVPYVLCQNIRPNRFIKRTFKYVSDRFHQKNRRSALQTGDVLTVQTGAGNGDTCVVPETYSGANCHALILSRPKVDKLNSQYLSEYLNSDKGRNRVHIIATGGAHPHLNTTDLRREILPLPSIAEQNAIVNAVSSVQNKIIHSENLMRQVILIKKALMQDLLTGKVRTTRRLIQCQQMNSIK